MPRSSRKGKETRAKPSEGEKLANSTSTMEKGDNTVDDFLKHPEALCSENAERSEFGLDARVLQRQIATIEAQKGEINLSINRLRKEKEKLGKKSAEIRKICDKVGSILENEIAQKKKNNTYIIELIRKDFGKSFDDIRIVREYLAADARYNLQKIFVDYINNKDEVKYAKEELNVYKLNADKYVKKRDEMMIKRNQERRYNMNEIAVIQKKVDTIIDKLQASSKELQKRISDSGSIYPETNRELEQQRDFLSRKMQFDGKRVTLDYIANVLAYKRLPLGIGIREYQDYYQKYPLRCMSMLGIDDIKAKFELTLPTKLNLDRTTWVGIANDQMQDIRRVSSEINPSLQEIEKERVEYLNRTGGADVQYYYRACLKNGHQEYLDMLKRALDALDKYGSISDINDLEGYILREDKKYQEYVVRHAYTIDARLHIQEISPTAILKALVQRGQCTPGSIEAKNAEETLKQLQSDYNATIKKLSSQIKFLDKDLEYIKEVIPEIRTEIASKTFEDNTKEKMKGFFRLQYFQYENLAQRNYTIFAHIEELIRFRKKEEADFARSLLGIAERLETRGKADLRRYQADGERYRAEKQDLEREAERLKAEVEKLNGQSNTVKAAQPPLLVQRGLVAQPERKVSSASLRRDLPGLKVLDRMEPLESADGRKEVYIPPHKRNEMHHYEALYTQQWPGEKVPPSLINAALEFVASRLPLRDTHRKDQAFLAACATKRAFNVLPDHLVMELNGKVRGARNEAEVNLQWDRLQRGRVKRLDSTPLDSASLVKVHCLLSYTPHGHPGQQILAFPIKSLLSPYNPSQASFGGGLPTCVGGTLEMKHLISLPKTGSEDTRGLNLFESVLSQELAEEMPPGFSEQASPEGPKPFAIFEETYNTYYYHRWHLQGEPARKGDGGTNRGEGRPAKEREMTGDVLRLDIDAIVRQLDDPEHVTDEEIGILVAHAAYEQGVILNERKANGERKRLPMGSSSWTNGEPGTPQYEDFRRSVEVAAIAKVVRKAASDAMGRVEIDAWISR